MNKVNKDLEKQLNDLLTELDVPKVPSLYTTVALNTGNPCLELRNYRKKFIKMFRKMDTSRKLEELELLKNKAKEYRDDLDKKRNQTSSNE